MSSALIIIDIQNDYFPGGLYPQWEAEAVLARIEAAAARAQAQGMPVIFVQHIADPSTGPAPFFNAETEGAALHPRLRAAAAEAPVVVKMFADAFERTALQATLEAEGVDELLICGMMTQNCVTHTALSPRAEGYAVTVISDCCTSVDAMIHQIALHGMSTRVSLVTAEEVGL